MRKSTLPAASDAWPTYRCLQSLQTSAVHQRKLVSEENNSTHNSTVFFTISPQGKRAAGGMTMIMMKICLTWAMMRKWWAETLVSTIFLFKAYTKKFVVLRDGCITQHHVHVCSHYDVAARINQQFGCNISLFLWVCTVWWDQGSTFMDPMKRQSAIHQSSTNILSTWKNTSHRINICADYQKVDAWHYS